MRIGEIHKRAKQFALVNKYGPLILYATVVPVIAVFGAISFFLPWFAFIFIPLYFLYSPIQFSQTDYYLRSYNLKTEENFRLFEGFKRDNFVRALLLSLIKTGFGLIVFIGIPIGIFIGMGTSIGIWAGFGIGCLITLVMLVPGLFFFSKSSLSFLLLCSDPKQTAWGAFKLSFQLTSKHTGKLIGLFFSYFGWFLLGLITGGMMLIYAVPHYQTAKSIMFRNIILGLDDDAPLSLAELEKSGKIAALQSLAERVEKKSEKASKTKKSADRRNVIPADIDFEKQQEDILKLINDKNAVVPEVGREKNDKEKSLEIRENETFDEYRARIHNMRMSETAVAQSKEGAVNEDAPKTLPDSDEIYNVDEDTIKTIEEQIHKKTAAGADLAEDVDKPKSEEAIDITEANVPDLAKTAKDEPVFAVSSDTDANKAVSPQPAVNGERKRLTREELLEKFRRK